MSKRTVKHLFWTHYFPFFQFILFRRLLRVLARVPGVSRPRLGPEFFLDVVQPELGRQRHQPARDEPRRGGSDGLQQHGREDQQARRVLNHQVPEATSKAGQFHTA